MRDLWHTACFASLMLAIILTFVHGEYGTPRMDGKMAPLSDITICIHAMPSDSIQWKQLNFYGTRVFECVCVGCNTRDTISPTLMQ